MTYGTVFSGIGGWEIGLNACGWKLQWQCERDPFCRAVLAERFGVPCFDDVTTATPWPVNVLAGSPPCQPFSRAGKRRGAKDDRHLWPSMLRLVRLLRPTWCLLENVTGIDDGVVVDEICADLESANYEVGPPLVVPACAVGADHLRNRVWIVANTDSPRELQPQGGIEEQRRWAGHRNQETASDSLREGLPTPGEHRAATRSKESEHVQPTAAGFPGRETYPSLLREIHGVPNRMDRIKALGNAVVPKIPFLIGQAINQSLIP